MARKRTNIAHWGPKSPISGVFLCFRVLWTHNFPMLPSFGPKKRFSSPLPPANILAAPVPPPRLLGYPAPSSISINNRTPPPARTPPFAPPHIVAHRVRGPRFPQISSEFWGFSGVATVIALHPPKGPVAPVALELPLVSHVKLPLKRCRATGGCSNYTCGCRATLCNYGSTPGPKKKSSKRPPSVKLTKFRNQEP